MATCFPPLSTNEIRFYAIGDFGNPTPEMRRVAAAMQLYSEMNGPPNFILGLGDNFYPSGVDSVDDRQFKTSWENLFLQHSHLRVPWYIILGNHDYMGIPQAQVKFTHSPKNPEGIWNLPHEFYKISFESSTYAMDLFGIDTNGCQSHVVRSHPYTPNLLRQEREWLDEQLQTSTAKWKIVFGHHPMYTRGQGHRDPCICFRDEQYQYMKYHKTRHEQVPTTAQGFGFESVLIQNSADAYISGHEHVFQHHSAGNVLHIVCGNSGADMRRGYGFYGGENKDQGIDWFDKSNTPGFVEFRVTEDLLIVNFISYESHIFHTVTKSK